MPSSKKHVSQSEAKTFHRCKRQWYLSYIRRFRAKQLAPSPLTLGQYVHTAMEFMNEDWKAKLQELVEADLVKVHELQHPEVFNQHELAIILAEDTMAWVEETGANAGIEIIEREYQMAVDMGRYILMGKLDEYIRRANGVLSIRDWKTAQDFRLFRLADVDLQFKTYIAMLQIIHGTAEVPMEGEWIVTKKNKRTARAKPPFVDSKKITYNQAQIDAVVRFWDATVHQMLYLIEMHESGDYHLDMLFPPAPNYDCGNCPHRDLCPLMDDGSAWEEYAEDVYDISNPNERYSDVKVLGSVLWTE